MSNINMVYSVILNIDNLSRLHCTTIFMVTSIANLWYNVPQVCGAVLPWVVMDRIEFNLVIISFNVIRNINSSTRSQFGVYEPELVRFKYQFRSVLSINDSLQFCVLIQVLANQLIICLNNFKLIQYLVRFKYYRNLVRK